MSNESFFELKLIVVFADTRRVRHFEVEVKPQVTVHALVKGIAEKEESLNDITEYDYKPYINGDEVHECSQVGISAEVLKIVTSMLTANI